MEGNINNVKIELHKQVLEPIAGESIAITNPSFTSNINNWTNPSGEWTWTSGGKACFTHTGIGGGLWQYFEENIPSEGVWYTISVEVSDMTQGQLLVFLGSQQAGQSITSNGTYELSVLANSSPTQILFLPLSSGGWFDGCIKSVQINRDINASPVGYRETYVPWNYLEVTDYIEFPLTYTVKPIFDIDSISSKKSKKIKVPGTAHNNEVFADLASTNADFSTFKVNKKYKAVVIANDVPIFEGYMQLMSVEKESVANDLGNQVYYNIRLFDEARSFFEVIGDTKISELNWGELNHTFGWSALTESWGTSEQDNVWTNGYYYPLLWSDNDRYSLTEFHPATYLKYILEKVRQNYGFNFQIDPQLDAVWKRMLIPYQGTRVSLKDNLFDWYGVYADSTGSGGTQHTGSIGIIPFQNGGVSFPDAEITIDNRLNLSNTTDPFYEGTGPNMDLDVWQLETTDQVTYTTSSYGNNTQDLGWNYVVPRSGYYDFEVLLSGTMKISQLSTSTTPFGQGFVDLGNNNATVGACGAGQVIINIYGQGGGAHSSITGPRYNQTIDEGGFANSSGLFLNEGESTTGTEWRAYSIEGPMTGLYLEEGQRITFAFRNWGFFAIRNTNVGGIPPTFTALYRRPRMEYFVADNSYIKIIPQASDVQPGDIIDYKKWAPQMKIKDLFKSLQQAFNLYMYSTDDDQRTIKITTRDNYYSGATVLNWNDKISKDNTIQLDYLRDLTDSEIRFKYKSSDDQFNEQWNSLNPELEFGEYRKEFDTDFSDSTGKIELDFVPTPIVQNGLAQRVPAIDAAKPGKGYRWLYLHETAQNLDVYARWQVLGDDDEVLVDELYDYPKYYPAVHHDSFTTPTFDLNFGAVGSGLLTVGSPVSINNLYNKYWFKYANLLNQSKVMEAWFFLDLADVNEIKNDLSHLIWVEDSYWHISQVKDFNPIFPELTKVELVKVEGVDISDFTISGIDQDTDSDTDTDVDIDISLPNDGDGWQPVDNDNPDIYVPIGSVPVGKRPPNNDDVILTDDGIIHRAHNENKVPGSTGKAIGTRNNMHSRTKRGGNLAVGYKNTVNYGTRQSMIVGQNNQVGAGLKDVIILGADNLNVQTSNYINIGNGLLVIGGEVVEHYDWIDGGEDEIYDYGNTHPAVWIDSGDDAIVEFDATVAGPAWYDAGKDAIEAEYYQTNI